MNTKFVLAGALTVLVALAGCTAATDPKPSLPVTIETSPAPDTPTIEPAPSKEAAPEETIVSFTSGSTVVEVIMEPDNPAASDFISMLPLTLSIEEYGGREKISYLPRSLEVLDTPGSKPENGDLSYYAPWGNLVFYYNTDDLEYSDQTIHLGTYNANLDQLSQLEGDNVFVEVIE